MSVYHSTRANRSLANFSETERPADAALIRRETTQQLEQAVAKLSDREREIILLRHDRNLSNQKTAEALGLSAQAASMRYLRAIRRLRQLVLANECNG